MSGESVRVVGSVTVKDMSAFRPHMEKVIRETRKEAGCVETNLYVEVGKEDGNKVS